MSNPVVIDFIVKGMPDVQRAMRGVEAATAAAARSSERASKRAGDAAVRAADATAKMQIAAMRKADRAHQQALDKGARYADGVIKKELRAKEQAAKATIALEERVARDVVRIKERAAKDAARGAAKVEREQMQDAARWVKKRQRENFIQERDEMRNRRAFAGAVSGAAAAGVGRGISKVAGAASGVAGMVGQLGGGFGIGDSVQRGVALKGKLADMASRDKAANPDQARKSTAELEGHVRGVAGEYGIEADKGADALDKFASKTGKLKTGMDMLGGLAELSRAGVGSLDDLADAAGDVFNADQTQSGEQVLEMLRGFALQGAKGSVEMKDMAAKLGKITAAAGRFKGGTAHEMLTLGALAQGAKESGGAASASEAMTSVSSLANQFGKNARIKGMRGLDVQAKTDDGFNRPVEEVLMDLMRGAEKASRKGGHGMRDFDVAFGGAIADAQAQKATNPLTKAFKEAGGGDAGIAAAKAQLGKFGAGGRDLKGEFAASAKARMGEDDVKMAKIKEQFDKAVSQKIIPALLQLVPEFERLVPLLVDLNAVALPAFVDLLKTVGEFASAHKGLIQDIAAHPIGSILAFEVTKSVGGALLGEGLKAIIAKSFGDAAMGNVLSKVMSSQLGQAGLIVGAASIAIAAGIIAIDNEYKNEDKMRENANADATEAARIAARMANGTATDEEKAKAAATAAKLRADIGAVQNNADNPGFWKTAGAAVGNVVAPSATAEATQNDQQQQARQIADLNKTLRSLETAMKNNTAAVAGQGGKPGAGGARGKSMVERN